MSHSDKQREQAARRTATGMDLRVEKSRSRTGDLAGTYQVVDPYRNTIVSGSTTTGYGLDLNDLEAALAE